MRLVYKHRDGQCGMLCSLIRHYTTINYLYTLYFIKYFSYKIDQTGTSNFKYAYNTFTYKYILTEWRTEYFDVVQHNQCFKWPEIFVNIRKILMGTLLLRRQG